MPTAELPKSTPQWVRERITRLEYENDAQRSKIGRLTDNMAKAQEDFEGVFKILRDIADGRIADPTATTKAVVERWLEEGRIE